MSTDLYRGSRMENKEITGWKTLQKTGRAQRSEGEGLSVDMRIEDVLG